MTAAQEFKSSYKRRGWCVGGHIFANQHTTLASAWHACQRGTYMAYWIYKVLPLDIQFPYMEFRQMADGGGVFQGPGNEALYARRIRARFNSDGSRRKRAKR